MKNDSEQEHTKNLTTSLQHYLTGYGRDGPEPLQDLLSFEQWRLMAQQELERRRRHFFECLDNEILKALASGDIDLHKTVNAVLDQDVVIAS